MTDYKSISPKEAKAIMDSGIDYLLVDVRPAVSYQIGHIEGAINLPLASFRREFTELYPNKETKILIYCQMGSKAKEAARFLAEEDYADVMELGGISFWPYEIVK